jgi:hypothetical protein
MIDAKWAESSTPNLNQDVRAERGTETVAYVRRGGTMTCLNPILVPEVAEQRVYCGHEPSTSIPLVVNVKFETYSK